MSSRFLVLLQAGALLFLACDSGTSPVAPEGTILTISADPLRIRPGETSEIRVVALHPSGVPVRTGTEFRFATTLGTIEPEVARTDPEGVVLATLTAGGRTGTAEVTARSGSGDTKSVEVEITVPSVTAAFTHDAEEPGRLLTVKFTDGSTGSPTSWKWEFGDGATSRERNPLHSYVEAGSYRVALEASNPDASDVTSKLVQVGVIVDFAVDAAKSEGLKVEFRDDTEPTPNSWEWRFGDGARSRLQHPVHTYAATGDYRVRLEVSTPSSGSGRTSRVIRVEADLPDPPVARFNNPPAADRNGLVIIFRDGSTGGDPTSWKWEFGDGATSSEQDPVHEYSAPDTYVVTLTVANAAGSDSFSRFVEVP